MDNHSETPLAVAKIGIAWLGTLFGVLSAAQVILALLVLIATLTFTVLQIYKIILELQDRRAKICFAQKLGVETTPMPL
jgi:hypothetical protein